MLTSLRISNFAIIESLEVEFGPGLNVMTGETGAGKSILINAINLLLGARASGDLIRTGEDSAKVEAHFLVQNDEELLTSLDEMGIEVGEQELVLHRTVVRNGRGRITVNGSALTASMLSKIACRLIDISGQHAHQVLLDPQSHRLLIDSYGEMAPLSTEMGQTFLAYAKAKDSLKEMELAEQDRVQREEFVRFQYSELEDGNLQLGEDDQLAEERQVLGAAEDLVQAANCSHETLYAKEGAVSEIIASVCARLEKAAAIDSKLVPLVESLKGVAIDVEEVSRSLGDYAFGLESNPTRLEQVEARLAQLEGLKKKYRTDLNGLISRRNDLQEELDQLESYDEVLAQRRQLEVDTKSEAMKVAERISASRKKVSKSLSSSVTEVLAELGMKRASFDVELTKVELSEFGYDHVEFLISPNVGEEPKPLAKIASGGELSRVTLALKSILSRDHGVGTYVFDEVDAGIGGAIAEVVGRKILDLSTSHQVLCITHLPQIASFGPNHLRVEKVQSAGRTRTLVSQLEIDEREEEIARMLGGLEITSQTRAHARQMLSNAQTGISVAEKKEARA